MFGGNHFLGENDILDNRSALGTYTVSVTCQFPDIEYYCFSSLFPFFIYLSRSPFVFFSPLLAFSLTLSSSFILSLFLLFLVPLFSLFLSYSPSLFLLLDKVRSVAEIEYSILSAATTRPHWVRRHSTHMAINAIVVCCIAYPPSEIGRAHV